MMDRLPSEILYQIFELLPQNDLVNLQSVSRHLTTLARDNNLWRAHCFDKSPAVRVRGWTTFAQALTNPSTRTTDANEAAATFASMLQTVDAGNSTTSTNPFVAGNGHQDTTHRSQRLKEIAEWDPSYESERVDWYSEYIARCAPLSISWFAKPMDGNEVRGLAYIEGWSERRAFGPLEDGTVCIWNVDGGEIGRSVPRALFGSEDKLSTFPGAVECVNVDSSRNQAFVAVEDCLKRIDLGTLQVVSSHSFTYPITALSQSSSLTDTPLVVGTKAAVHLYDPRTNIFTPKALTSLGTPPASSSSSDSYPLSILNVSPHSIYLAGRYPSILTYDRRFFPRLEDTIYSGARLCSLGLSSHTPTSPNLPSVSTLLACGEYNGRGSLELYSLPHSKSSSSPSSTKPSDSANPTASQTYKNRQTASRSKLLSVSPHGTRIIFSDADGGLKWVERDGSSLVRSWNINQFSFLESSSRTTPGRRILEFGAMGGDVVRKIVPIDAESQTKRGRRGDGEILLWTGEKAGLLRFKDQEEEWEDAREKIVDEAEAEARVGASTASRISHHDNVDGRERESGQERRMQDAMRRALMRQADEINWMRRFGLRSD